MRSKKKLNGGGLKKLWGMSGNICSFPGCGVELVPGKKLDRVIGEEAHIKGERPTSARYDPNQPNEERESEENRILLCPTHHTIVDAAPETWTVECLRKMKAEHEQWVKKAVQPSFVPNDLISFPANIDFQGNNDDIRIFTPPLAHRRVIDGALEFGSLVSFPHSWASLGNIRILCFDLEFEAAFRNTMNDGWMGVGFRSQSYFANFEHLFYLKQNGAILLTQPDETAPNFYTDKLLRAPVLIDQIGFHSFHVRFTPDTLLLSIDNFSISLDVMKLPKVLGPGLIRFQSCLSWMTIKKIRASTI
jgi:hypothetical protein